MKKMIIAALVAVFVTTSAFAADVKVGSRISDHFSMEYADATNVSWTVNNSFAKASFELDGEKMEAFYQLDGTLIGSSKSIGFEKLPKSAIKTITQKYPFPPYELKECIEFTLEDGSKKFYTSLLLEGKEKLVLEIDNGGSVSIFKKDKLK